MNSLHELNEHEVFNSFVGRAVSQFHAELTESFCGLIKCCLLGCVTQEPLTKSKITFNSGGVELGLVQRPDKAALRRSKLAPVY